MLRATVFHGNSEYAWNTMPRSAPGPTTRSPSTRTSPVVGRLEAADDRQQRRLATARRAEQADQLAVTDVQVDVVEGDDGRRPLRTPSDTATVTLAVAMATSIGVPAACGDGHGRAHGATSLRSRRSSRSLTRPITPKTMSRANIESIGPEALRPHDPVRQALLGGEQLGDHEHQPGGGQVDPGDVDHARPRVAGR